MIKFPYYSGNIKNSTVIGYVSLDDFIKSHKEPTAQTLNILEQIDIAVKHNNLKLKNRLKTQLYAFTPSVMIEIGKTRVYDNISAFTGLMQIDLDKIPTRGEAIDLKDHIFHEHEEIVCCYLSPSKRGIKALMRVNLPQDIEHYKALHKAVERDFSVYGYFDHATTNAILPLFLSADQNILYRDYEKTKIWTLEDWSKKVYVQLNDEPTTTSSSTENYEKCVRLVTKAITDITDNGHPQVVRASLILGSRVGAGYITGNEARHLIEKLIKDNDYLSKGTAGYVKTAMWGINNGIINPKYYKE